MAKRGERIKGRGRASVWTLRRVRGARFRTWMGRDAAYCSERSRATAPYEGEISPGRLGGRPRGTGRHRSQRDIKLHLIIENPRDPLAAQARFQFH